jgi:hypothetical protein
MKIVTEKLGRGLTKNYREDVGSLIQRFAQFLHVSQFENLPRNTKEIPKDRAIAFRIDGSPTVAIGEMVFAIDNEGRLTWLQEIIDSTD